MKYSIIIFLLLLYIFFHPLQNAPDQGKATIYNEGRNGKKHTKGRIYKRDNKVRTFSGTTYEYSEAHFLF